MREIIIMEELLQVGVITQTHGIRGEVKVFPTTDDAARFQELRQVLLDTGKETISLEIENVKFFKQFVILKFKGYDNINDIERYKRCALLVKRDDAVPLEEDEYYIADMIGMKVVTDRDEEFGILKNVMETGANDVYVIEHPSEGEVLIPAIKECILDVDIPGRLMKIHVMDGLI
jgi:16S rRNA processing protein RimM